MAQDLETVLSALRAADSAGDVEGAKRLAEIASSFQSTPGGAATGNPSIQAQGAAALRPDVQGKSPAEALAAIGGAAGIGGTMGAFAPELATGAGRVISALPFPGARVVGAGLEAAAPALRAAGRPAGAIAGAVAGAAGETAGQAAEAAGAPQILAEGARLVGGGVGAETANLAKEVLKKYALVPALGLASKFKHEAAKKLLEKLQMGSSSLAAQEQELLASIQNEIRGGPKSDIPLENVGNIMGAEGQRLENAATLRTTNALNQASNVGNLGTPSTAANIGSALQKTINERNAGALAARSQGYANNEKARDFLVAQKEKSGQYIDSMPEYQSLVASLKDELQPGLHSPDVASDFSNILSQITTKSKAVPQPFGGMGADPFAAVTEKKPPVTFQQLDEVRRQLGEVFRGKPPEGYKAIDAATARKYYAEISDIQKNYAGGPNGPQANLLDKYAADTAGLEQFSSKFGKKATALDQYREGQYATDPSALPSTFFKTRASIKALQELTGNKAQVDAAALAHANMELAGKDANGVRAWMGKNAEWLSETGTTRTAIEQYATKLADAERSMKNAQEFAKQAASDSNLLIGKAMPAQRAVDLIKSGDAELWGKVIPAINRSPQARTQMVSAARQVIADQASAKGTADLFARNIRPFLEKSGIATTAEMDAVAKGLADIQTRTLPEAAKLGFMKRMILQSFGGYSAATASRAGVGGYGLLSDLVPQ